MRRWTLYELTTVRRFQIDGVSNDSIKCMKIMLEHNGREHRAPSLWPAAGKQLEFRRVVHSYRHLTVSPHLLNNTPPLVYLYVPVCMLRVCKSERESE